MVIMMDQEILVIAPDYLALNVHVPVSHQFPRDIVVSQKGFLREAGDVDLDPAAHFP